MKIKNGIPIRDFFDINSGYSQAELGACLGLAPSATCRSLQRGDDRGDVYVVTYEDGSIGWLRSGRKIKNINGLRFK